MKRALIGTYWTNLKDAKKDALKKMRKRKFDFAIIQGEKAYIVVGARQLE